MFRKSWILLAPFVSRTGCDGFESESRGRAFEAIAETVQDAEAVEALEVLQEAESEERQGDPGDTGGELMAPVKASEADTPHAPYALLVSAAAGWKYLAQGTTCVTPANNNWKGGGIFDDGTWVVGRAELGYGDGDERMAAISYSIARWDGGETAAQAALHVDSARQFIWISRTCRWGQSRARVHALATPLGR